MTSAIEWTDETWNPIRARRRLEDGTELLGWHCEHASPGCVKCYAETRNINGRCNLGTKLPYKPGHRKDVEIFLDEKALLKPLGWRKPRMIFPCSMTDIFADFVTDDMLDRIFAVMALCPQHTFQVLTKRADRMRAYFNRYDAAHDDNCADMVARADERIPHLLATPASVRFLSCEPLLGPVDLTRWMPPAHHHPDNVPSADLDVLVAATRTELRRRYPDADVLDWIIAGGESGPGARPMHPDWARSLRDQCAAAGVPFFFKQWGEWVPDFEVCPDFPDDDPEQSRFETCVWDPEQGRFERTNGSWTDGDYWYSASDYWQPEQPMTRVGKKKAGRLLDGIEHNGMPGPVERAAA